MPSARRAGAAGGPDQLHQAGTAGSLSGLQKCELFCTDPLHIQLFTNFYSTTVNTHSWLARQNPAFNPVSQVSSLPGFLSLPPPLPPHLPVLHKIPTFKATLKQVPTFYIWLGVGSSLSVKSRYPFSLANSPTMLLI